VLDDFGVFWRIEEDPEEKRELLQLISNASGSNAGIVAVRPKEAFAVR
jgi:hypothetical protein